MDLVGDLAHYFYDKERARSSKQWESSLEGIEIAGKVTTRS